MEHIRTIHAVDWVHFNVARHYWCLGNPIDFVLTQGQASDIGQGQRLVELTPTGTQAFMADKFYDCDWLIDAIEQENMIAVIPSKSNCITPRQCDFFAYKERHLIECFFGKIKHYWCIFARYEKKLKITWALLCSCHLLSGFVEMSTQPKYLICHY